MDMVTIDQERCNLCGLCISVCVRRIIEEGDDSVRITDPMMCILCGHCKAVCPEDAPNIPSLKEEEFEPLPPKEDLPKADQLMGFFRSRRSTRIYGKEPVERDKMEKIIEAGRFAPTGGNRQPIRYVVVHTPDKMEMIRKMTFETLVEEGARIDNAVKRHGENGEPISPEDMLRHVYTDIWRDIAEIYQQQGKDLLFYHAPVLVICHFDPEVTTTAEVDAGMAAMQMALMAEALGLGTCYCGFLCMAIRASLGLRDALQIPVGDRVPVSFMLGYPDVPFIKLVSRDPAHVKWL